MEPGVRATARCGPRWSRPCARSCCPALRRSPHGARSPSTSIGLAAYARDRGADPNPARDRRAGRRPSTASSGTATRSRGGTGREGSPPTPQDVLAATSAVLVAAVDAGAGDGSRRRRRRPRRGRAAADPGSAPGRRPGHGGGHVAGLPRRGPEDEVARWMTPWMTRPRARWPDYLSDAAGSADRGAGRAAAERRALPGHVPRRHRRRAVRGAGRAGRCVRHVARPRSSAFMRRPGPGRLPGRAEVRWFEPTGTVLGQPFFVMDFVEGAELADERAMDEATAADFVRAAGRRCTPSTGRPPASSSALVPPAPVRRPPTCRSSGGPRIYRGAAAAPIPLLEEAAAWLHRHAPPLDRRRRRPRRRRAGQRRPGRRPDRRRDRLGVRPPRRSGRGLVVLPRDAGSPDDAPGDLAGPVRRRSPGSAWTRMAGATGRRSTSSRVRAPTAPA